MTVNEHQTRTRWNSEGFRAECSCGWEGQRRDNAANALIDGHSHAKVARDYPNGRIAVDPANPANEVDLDEVDR